MIPPIVDIAEILPDVFPAESIESNFNFNIIGDKTPTKSDGIKKSNTVDKIAPTLISLNIVAIEVRTSPCINGITIIVKNDKNNIILNLADTFFDNAKLLEKITTFLKIKF